MCAYVRSCVRACVGMMHSPGVCVRRGVCVWCMCVCALLEQVHACVALSAGNPITAVGIVDGRMHSAQSRAIAELSHDRVRMLPLLPGVAGDFVPLRVSASAPLPARCWPSSCASRCLPTQTFLPPQLPKSIVRGLPGSSAPCLEAATRPLHSRRSLKRRSCPVHVLGTQALPECRMRFWFCGLAWSS